MGFFSFNVLWNMRDISVNWLIIVINNMAFCQTKDCVTGKVENNQ